MSRSDETPIATPSWDPARGRANRMARLPTPFDTLDTPFRIRRAAEQSALAAGAIACSNALSAVFTAFGGVPNALLGHDPPVLAGIQASAALLAAGLAIRSGRRPSLALAAVILVWSVVEAMPWIPYALYGHGFAGGRMGFLMWLVVAAAVLGVRGALEQRRAAVRPPQ